MSGAFSCFWPASSRKNCESWPLIPPLPMWLAVHREIRTNQNPAYNGTYEMSSHLLSVSYGYSF